jgi:hypothetical protein
MASVQVPVNAVVDPSVPTSTTPVGSTRVAVNDVNGQASTEPTPQVMQPGNRIIRR